MGATVHIREKDIAMSFIQPLAAALAEQVASDVAVVSPAGCGWRSRLVEKKLLRKLDKMSPADDTVAPSLDEDDEVQSRLAAMEVAIRAQVRAQFRGTPCRSSRFAIQRDDHVLANAAKHHFVTDESFENLSAALVPSVVRAHRRRTQMLQFRFPCAASFFEGMQVWRQLQEQPCTRGVGRAHDTQFLDR